MSAAEFAALQSLPEQGRRAQLGMPSTCAPGLTALKGDAAKSDRLTVLVSCKAPDQLEQPPAKLMPPR